MPQDQLIAICILGVFYLFGIRAGLLERFRKPKQSKHAVK